MGGKETATNKCPLCKGLQLSMGKCRSCMVDEGLPVPCRHCGGEYLFHDSDAYRPMYWCSQKCYLERDWDITEAEMAAVHLVREFGLTERDIVAIRETWPHYREYLESLCASEGE